MIANARAPRGAARAARSQLAGQVLIAAIALIGAALLLRALFRAVGVSELVWSGAAIVRLTDPLVMPLAMIPGGTTRLVGGATLADLTAVAVATVVPLFVLSRPRPASLARTRA